MKQDVPMKTTTAKKDKPNIYLAFADKSVLNSCVFDGFGFIFLSKNCVVIPPVLSLQVFLTEICPLCWKLKVPKKKILQPNSCLAEVSCQLSTHTDAHTCSLPLLLAPSKGFAKHVFEYRSTRVQDGCNIFCFLFI